MSYGFSKSAMVFDSNCDKGGWLMNVCCY